MSDGKGFEVTVSAGSLRPSNGVVMAHRWTPEGVVVETEFTGAHLCHFGERRRQLAGLHRMAAFALGRFDYEGAQLRLLRHEHNTTFRVDSAGQRFVRRISRPGMRDRVTIAAEMAWLQAFEMTPTSARPGVVCRRRRVRVVQVRGAACRGDWIGWWPHSLMRS